MDSHEPKPRLRLHHGSGRRRQPLPLGRSVEYPDPVATIGPSRPVPGRDIPPSRPSQRTDTPILDPTDPRWVLAVRTGRTLRGDVLRPKDRDGLVRLGRLLGLRPFEVNLVIAIVQDRARRGLGTDASADLLRFVPLRSAEPDTGRVRRIRRVVLWSTVVLLTELLLILAVV